MENRLTIDQAYTLKDEIIETYKTHKGLKVQCEKCDAIDLSIIQLLYALHKTAQEDNKEVEIDIQLNEEQLNLLSNAGIYYETFTGKNKSSLSIKIK